MNWRLDVVQTNLLLFGCFRKVFTLVRFANKLYTLYNRQISEATFTKTAIKPKFVDWFCLKTFSAAIDQCTIKCPKFVSIENFLTCLTHRRTGRGGRGGLQPPQILGNSDFLGITRKFGQSQFLKTSPCLYYYFEEINIFYFKPEVGVIIQLHWHETASDCLARDEFLVMREGYHMLIFCIVGHCTAMGYFLSWTSY